MTAPLIVEYLRTHSAADLMRDHGVRMSVSRAHPYKASFNYDMTASRKDDALASQCRGLILSTATGEPFPRVGAFGELAVLARPMDRFFNIGEGPLDGPAQVLARDGDAAMFGARVYEKLDGMLVIVYHDTHAGAWCVASRGVADGDVPIDGFGDATARTLFESAVREQLGLSFAEFTSRLARNATYCFELTSPRIDSVVRSDVNKVHALAMRVTSTGIERDVHWAHQTLPDLPVAPSYDIHTIAELRTFVESRPGSEAEGVVVRLGTRAAGGAFARVKVKSSDYVARHHLGSGEVGSTPRNLLRIILAGTWDDARITVKPHLQAAGNALTSALRTWCAYIDATYVALRADAGDDRASFARAVKATSAGAGFDMAVHMARWTGRDTDAAAWLQGRRDLTIGHGRKGCDWSDGFLDSLAQRLASVTLPAEEVKS